ncbi:helix-hairpin-helix domain-containing protein [Enterococcus devriesei]|uniref:helix-hairpin-helix domain-containing protein n=1 Tax=Enterococcus TaxID=1350 RepID=UPI001C117D45|nr:helix-hairpin-helix domain-containing protein [Enterococcus devriesei]MBU5364960.1 helix-hairpin-helix domain-containing protein [Enterococcus devriesei]MDT2821385.1 helix-hairpin-helix domain-containing protein [Enterococcus devriesei]
MENDLKEIPGIGLNMEQHLIKAGYPTVASLKNQDPETIYLKDCIAQGTKVDRCALYVYRLAVHYANHEGRLPKEKQNWWDWQD